MKALMIIAAALSLALAPPVFADPSRGGDGDGGGWHNGERNGWSKNRDWPGETNGFVRQDYRAYLEALETGDQSAISDAEDALANTLEGYSIQGAFRGEAGQSGKVPGTQSQRVNGLPEELQF